MSVLPESIKQKLISIKDLLSVTDDNCFQYYFVKETDLPLLKQKINDIPKEDFNNLSFYSDISTPEIEDEFNELINSNFNFVEGLNATNESTRLQMRNIIINKDEHNASYVLHQDFNNAFEQNMFNILYYYNIDNCDLEQCGTGVVFIDKFGKRNYEILPVYPGLILVLRDKCMFHHTPNIEPTDKDKPIIRTLIRKYVGFNRYENDKNILLQSIKYGYLNKTIVNKKIKDLEKKIITEKCKTLDHKTELCCKYEEELEKLNNEYSKINEDEYKEMIDESNKKWEEQYYRIKYIKYKNKYNKLKNLKIEK